MFGRVLPVAARIERIDSMSARADAGEIVRWISGFERAPRMTYLVHGERPRSRPSPHASHPRSGGPSTSPRIASRLSCESVSRDRDVRWYTL